MPGMKGLDAARQAASAPLRGSRLQMRWGQIPSYPKVQLQVYLTKTCLHAGSPAEQQAPGPPTPPRKHVWPSKNGVTGSARLDMLPGPFQKLLLS